MIALKIFYTPPPPLAYETLVQANATENSKALNLNIDDCMLKII